MIISFLCERTRCVKVDGSVLKQLVINQGIVQGSGCGTNVIYHYGKWSACNI